MEKAFFYKLNFSVSLAQKSFQFCNLRLIFVLVPVTPKCFFGIFGQLCLPSARKTRMDAIFAGDLSKWLACLKFG